MKKLSTYFIFFFLFFNIEGNSDEISPIKKNFEEVFNVGKMISHDDKFTLYFRTREKAVLAKGEELNYITDYPQDLYILYNDTGKISPVITYDWFPKKVKELGSNFNLPVFPEDYAYYLLSDNETLVMISGIKSIKANYKFNLATQLTRITFPFLFFVSLSSFFSGILNSNNRFAAAAAARRRRRIARCRCCARRSAPRRRSGLSPTCAPRRCPGRFAFV